jgi:5-methylcytosine-specific restriction endonuclease McrA
MPRPHIPTRLRQEVFHRAGGCCEYCKIHQDDRPETHPLDHVLALRHGGQTEEKNLALACVSCNSNKGPNLAAIDPLTDEIVPLFNPRLQIWEEHFELSGALILGQTQTGRATVELLRFNEEEQRNYRQNLMEAGRYPRSQKV